MSIRGEVIPFVLPGTGTYTINHLTHVTDRAKGFIFFLAASIDSNSEEIYSLGYADANGNNIGNAAGLGESFGVCVASRAYQASYSIVSESTSHAFGGAVDRMRGYVSAVNVGSFNVTIDLNVLPNSNWYCVMLTGDSDVSISVGIATTADPQPKTITLSFRPVALLTLGVTIAVNGKVAGAFHNNGFAVACGPQQVGLSGSAGTITNRRAGFCSSTFIERDYDIANHVYGSNGTYALISWNLDGFTINRIAGTSNFNMWDIGYMAIGGNGVSANIVRITQPSLTGIQNHAILLNSPVMAFFSSRCKPASANVLFDFNMMFGAFAGNTNVCERICSPDLTSFPYSRDSSQTATKCVSMATATGVSTSTIDGEATCVLSPNNLALNWSTTNSLGADIWALVLGNSVLGVFNECGGALPLTGAGIYEIVLNKTHDTIYNPFPAEVDVKIP